MAPRRSAVLLVALVMALSLSGASVASALLAGGPEAQALLLGGGEQQAHQQGRELLEAQQTSGADSQAKPTQQAPAPAASGGQPVVGDQDPILAPTGPAPPPASFQAPDAPAPTGPLYVTPPASFAAMTDVYVDQPVLQIPQSFLGISHEWTHVEEINNIPGYKDIIRMLTSYGSGPMIIRVGGGSTDKQPYVFPQYVYDALRQVHYDTGTRYILGVTFETGDVTLAKNQMAMANNNLPSEAIINFEIGNEPNFYEGTQKSETGQTLDALAYSRCCYVPGWQAFTSTIACGCNTYDCCDKGKFAGPAWGHVNVYPTTIKWFLDWNYKNVDLVTLHWYKATKETYNTPATLLDEAPIRKEMDNLRALVEVSRTYGKPLRVAEMNSISNSGRVGVSNVFAATLWTLDGAFEVANAGAVGINLHQGSGQNLYTSILRWYSNGMLSPPVLRPPFYGMMAFQQAVRGGSKILGKTQLSGDASLLKVWPLIDAGDSELRFVIINKHPNKAGNQTVRINRSWGYNTPAQVSRLVARGEDPLSATSGITLGGYYYAVGGVQKGANATESVIPFPSGDQNLTTWNFYMPPGSAAIVRVPKAGQ